MQLSLFFSFCTLKSDQEMDIKVPVLDPLRAPSGDGTSGVVELPVLTPLHPITPLLQVGSQLTDSLMADGSKGIAPPTDPIKVKIHLRKQLHDTKLILNGIIRRSDKLLYTQLKAMRAKKVIDQAQANREKNGKSLKKIAGTKEKTAKVAFVDNNNWNNNNHDDDHDDESVVKVDGYVNMRYYSHQHGCDMSFADSLPSTAVMSAQASPRGSSPFFTDSHGNSGLPPLSGRPQSGRPQSGRPQSGRPSSAFSKKHPENGSETKPMKEDADTAPTEIPPIGDGRHRKEILRAIQPYVPTGRPKSAARLLQRLQHKANMAATAAIEAGVTPPSPRSHSIPATPRQIETSQELENGSSVEGQDINQDLQQPSVVTTSSSMFEQPSIITEEALEYEKLVREHNQRIPLKWDITTVPPDPLLPPSPRHTHNSPNRTHNTTPSTNRKYLKVSDLQPRPKNIINYRNPHGGNYKQLYKQHKQERAAAIAAAEQEEEEKKKNLAKETREYLDSGVGGFCYNPVEGDYNAAFSVGQHGSGSQVGGMSGQHGSLVTSSYGSRGNLSIPNINGQYHYPLHPYNSQNYGIQPNLEVLPILGRSRTTSQETFLPLTRQSSATLERQGSSSIIIMPKTVNPSRDTHDDYDDNESAKLFCASEDDYGAGGDSSKRYSRSYDYREYDDDNDDNHSAISPRTDIVSLDSTIILQSPEKML